MQPSTRQILLRADRVGEWEIPADVPDNFRLEVLSLAPSLESIVGQKLDVDRNVQDASFVTDIGLLDDREYDRRSDTGSLCYIFAVRFSYFGRLFTLHGDEWKERFDEFELGNVKEFLSSREFVYVCSDELDAPYDGLNSPENPISGEPITWWRRFFDYL